jgi:uncharacterized protein YecT (DUF1311 family)
MCKHCVLLGALLYAFATHAADDWDFAAPHKERCSHGGQQQMNRCLGSEYHKVDARLNAAYKRLLALLEDPSKLRKAQAAWLRFRDRTCEYANSGIGEGTLYPFAQAACYIDLTEKRIRDFQQYLEWDCNGCPPRT